MLDHTVAYMLACECTVYGVMEGCRLFVTESCKRHNLGTERRHRSLTREQPLEECDSTPQGVLCVVVERLAGFCTEDKGASRNVLPWISSQQQITV